MNSTRSHVSPSLCAALPITIAAVIVLAPMALTGCDNPARGDRAEILLFTGEGTSPGDIAAVEIILDRTHLDYATANSPELNRLTATQLMTYRLVIVPGGNFMDMSASLMPQTAARIHDAVQSGVNYLGICAGAFLAGDGRGYYRSFKSCVGCAIRLLRRRDARGAEGRRRDCGGQRCLDRALLGGWSGAVRMGDGGRQVSRRNARGRRRNLGPGMGNARGGSS